MFLIDRWWGKLAGGIVGSKNIIVIVYDKKIVVCIFLETVLDRELDFSNFEKIPHDRATIVLSSNDKEFSFILLKVFNL